MLNKKHILFLIPDGVGIKNYLYSDIISYLKKEAQITIWSPLPIEAFAEVKRIHEIDFGYRQIKLTPENLLTRLYREATTYARLINNSKLQNNTTILKNWRRSNYSLKVKLLYLFAESLGYILSKSYLKILKYEKKSVEKISRESIDTYIKDLVQLKPTSIFITHQRVAGLMPICLAAKRLKIKTATAIFSWDNLPKARLSVETDLYLVWSQWMKNEMKEYYPEIDDESVLLVGTPQFEFYLDETRIESRDSFAKKHRLDVNKNWVCFSGDDVITSPFDHLYLRDIANALYAENNNIQIIFRRCPVDFSARYDEELLNYKEFIVAIDPIWNIESQTGWVGYFPKFDDIGMQINLAYHCAMVINLGSTMALDFATYNKPCLYLNYNPSDDLSWNTEIIYNFQHFRSMKDLKAVGWINSEAEILSTVLKTINRPEDIAPDRKEWMETIVLHPLNTNSQNIASAIL